MDICVFQLNIRISNVFFSLSYYARHITIVAKRYVQYWCLLRADSKQVTLTWTFYIVLFCFFFAAFVIVS